MLFLLNKQNQALLEDKQQIEDLNKELITALEQLKTKNSEFQNVLVMKLNSLNLSPAFSLLKRGVQNSV